MKWISTLLGTAFGLVQIQIGVAADGSAAVQAMQAARAAGTALEAGDFEGAIAKLESAVELRPDFPQLLIDLARAQTGASQFEAAVATLERYARLGLHTPVEKMEEFATLKPRKDFQAVVRKVAANAHPKGDSDIAFSLRDVTGLLEGIAWREKTDAFYFGDVHHRAVWSRSKDGSLRRLTPDGDELFGVFGLAIDEANGAIWAATSAVPAMRGFSPELSGAAAVVEIDLESGAIRRTIPAARAPGTDAAHQLTDLALAPDGGLLVTDSAMPIVWRLRPGGNVLERFSESPEFFTLQGITVLPSGVAIVADQVNGLLRMDERGQVRRLETPADTTLVEIKALAVGGDNRVLAIQTDLRPSRVLALNLDAAADAVSDVAVLQSGHLAMGAPALGCMATAGHFHFIANSGASRFSGPDAQPTPPRQVPIMRTKLSKAK
jgi:sugar lactone lactonase YvrE